MLNAEEIIVSKIKPAKILRIMNNPQKSAEAVQLVYTNQLSSNGIARKRKNNTFLYYREGKKINNSKEISRINKLAIPPAWENVWICDLENGHLQATGLDGKRRKQYRYHPLWNALRNHTKFYRMLHFGMTLPKIRLRIEKDLSDKNISKNKVLALVLSLMERTNIRVGNTIYEKLYGSFGLTTLKDKHVKINGEKLRFTFKGKKGIYHDIEFRNRKLAKAVQNCRDIPGKELFQFYDEQGNRHSIDSGMVNDYIKEISGEDFTAKDFRTWSGTVNAFIGIKELGQAENKKEFQQKTKELYEYVSGHLGNTPAVCKKYYIHPLIINLYENQSLNKYLDELDQIEIDDGKSGLTKEELTIMRILENEKLS